MNEFAPQWSSPPTDGNGEFPAVTVPEDTPPGRNVVEFTASDRDHGIHGTVSYKIVSQVSGSDIPKTARDTRDCQL